MSTGQDGESERERSEGGREANEKVNSCQLCFAKVQDMITSSRMCPNPLLHRKPGRCQADRKKRAQTSGPSAELAPCIKTHTTCMWTQSYINTYKRLTYRMSCDPKTETEHTHASLSPCSRLTSFLETINAINYKLEKDLRERERQTEQEKEREQVQMKGSRQREAI